MNQNDIEKIIEETEEKVESTMSVVLDNTLAEMIIANRKAQFAVWDGEKVDYLNKIGKFVPWKVSNPLLTTGTVLLPSGADDFGTNKDLLEEIISHLKKYVALPDYFYLPTAIYVMMSWIYDRFSDVCYLRVVGIAGTGKTRFIKTVGRITYKPMNASGSASTSSLFRIIDLIGGTFVFDEADFESTDLWSEIVKILNSGHTKGSPVLRSQATNKHGEFIPRPFRVFGPKVIASRMRFKDDALESRCISEEMIPKDNTDKPIYLGDEFETEALALRNKLLMFRFKNYFAAKPVQDDEIKHLDGRMRQTALSLVSTANLLEDKNVTQNLYQFLKQYAEEITMDRNHSDEADLLFIIHKILLKEKEDPKTKGIRVYDIAEEFNRRFGLEYGMEIKDGRYVRNQLTAKKAGWIIRQKLRLKTERKNVGFCIPLSEYNHIVKLMQRYGLKTELSG